MAAPLSIIIPTYNAAPIIGPCLNALMPGVMAGLVRELIIVDGGSTDETLVIAEAAGATIIEAEKGRGPQLVKGAAEADGDWLLFLHADTRLSDGWNDVVQSFIEQNAVGRAAAFQFRLDDPGIGARFLAAMVRLRCALFRLPYGDQGLLIANAHYQKTGGFRPLPIMEDVALVRSIGWRAMRSLRADAVTSADRYQKDGYLKRSMKNLYCLGLYFLGVSPERLVRIYRS